MFATRGPPGVQIVVNVLRLIYAARAAMSAVRCDRNRDNV